MKSIYYKLDKALDRLLDEQYEPNVNLVITLTEKEAKKLRDLLADLED